MRDRIQHIPAELVEVVELAATRAATHRDTAVRIHEDRQRTDTRVALADTGAKHLRLEGRQHPGELRWTGRNAGGHIQLRGDEQ